MSVCERAGAPVIRVTVFTFPLRCTGAQAAQGDRGALHCAVCSHKCVCVYVCVFVWGWWGGALRIIALQSFLDHPYGVLMSLAGLWVLLVPTEQKGHPTFFILFSLCSPPSIAKVFID